MGDEVQRDSEGPLTIDGGLLGAMPVAVSEAVRDLCQGDVLELAFPLVYLAGVSHPIWAPTADYLNSPDGSGLNVVVHEGGEEPVCWIITSQTCDIGKPNWPWIQVSPVFDLSGAAMERVIARKGPEYLWHLPGVPDGVWVADLRIEVPIEKSLLVGCVSRTGHVDEGEANAFGERLAYLKSRAALADGFVEAVQSPLRKALLGMQKSPLFETLDQCDVYLRTDSRLRPTWAQIVVVHEAGDDAAVAEWWDVQWERLSKNAEAVGINLMRTQLRSPAAVNLAEYRTLIRFPLSGLSEALPDG